MAFVAAALVVAVYLLARRIGHGWCRAPRRGRGGGGDVRAALQQGIFFRAADRPLPGGRDRAPPGRPYPRRGTRARSWCARARAEPSVRAGSAAGRVATYGLRDALRTAAGAVPGIAATFAYNIARFGHPLSFGYEDVGFTTPLLTGLSGLLFEPRKSLLLFAPIAAVLPLALWHLWRSDRAGFVLIAANFGITFAAVAMWFAWHGGWCWGPRLLIPGLVPAIAAVGPWLVRPARWRVAALLFALGVAVSLPAVLVPTQAQQLERCRRCPGRRTSCRHSPWRARGHGGS